MPYLLGKTYFNVGCLQKDYILVARLPGAMEPGGARERP